MRYAYHFGRRGFFDIDRIRWMNEIGFDWTIQGQGIGKISESMKEDYESPQDPEDADRALQSRSVWGSNEGTYTCT